MIKKDEVVNTQIELENIFLFYDLSLVFGSLAEEVGFEPTVGVNPRRFSRPVHSTTLPLLRHPSNYRKIFDS